jgi:U32 family peptidase
MKPLSNTIEIMSPVGSYESLMAAFQAGAGSVYFGVGKLNMRARASVHFTMDDMAEIALRCRDHGLRSYLTLNTVIYDEEAGLMRDIVDAAKQNGISAIIASDISVLEYAREAGMEIHISTQCNITNIDAVRFFSRYADVVVLARELDLGQVKSISLAIQDGNITGPSGNPVRIEVFVHGALCMAISGKCYLSLDNYGHSANRGACYQPCRRGYIVKDKEEETELEIDNEYIMSPKDLCTIGFLDKIADAGASVLKIEGRGRSAEYVKTVTRCYREAVDSIMDGTYGRYKVGAWTEQLKTVYNRGFWDGYYLGKKLGEWSARYGSHATTKKIYVGKVTNYFTKLGVAEIRMEAGGLNTGDEYIISGPTTGVYQDIASEIRVHLEVVAGAAKGDDCSLPVKELVRRNDKVYKVVPSDIT